VSTVTGTVDTCQTAAIFVVQPQRLTRGEKLKFPREI